MTTRPVAKTIVAVANGQGRLIEQILDRSRPVTEQLIDEVLSLSQCHYAGRRPKRPTDTPTDMDLVSYLLQLWRQSKVVSIDSYDRLTPRVSIDADKHIGDIRFGELIGLVSHQTYLSFGVELRDVSVVKTDGVTDALGQPRSFTVLDPRGGWHVPPASIEWNERADESEFNAHHQFTRDDIIRFTHRNRRESVFGAPYMHLKLLCGRLSEEIAHYKRPFFQSAAAESWLTNDIASEIVPTFVMKLDGPERFGSYDDICNDDYRQQLWRWRQVVQWLMRVDEFAFFDTGLDTDYTAPWVREVEWKPVRRGWKSIQLHPELALSYKLQYRSRAVRASMVA